LYVYVFFALFFVIVIFIGCHCQSSDWPGRPSMIGVVLKPYTHRSYSTALI